MILKNWLQDENAEMVLVHKILEPHELNITEAFKVAWQAWQALCQSQSELLRRPLGARTRANFINDHICHEIKQRFNDMPGVSIAEHMGFLILNFSNLVLLRFKMLNDARQASNIQTQRQKDYDNQLELPDLPPKAIRIVAGYQLDRVTQTQISDILITRPVRKNVLWHYSILKDGVATLQSSLLAEEQPSQTAQPEKRRVKAKKLKDMGD